MSVLEARMLAPVKGRRSGACTCWRHNALTCPSCFTVSACHSSSSLACSPVQIRQSLCAKQPSTGRVLLPPQLTPVDALQQRPGLALQRTRPHSTSIYSSPTALRTPLCNDNAVKRHVHSAAGPFTLSFTLSPSTVRYFAGHMCRAGAVSPSFLAN